MECRASLIRAVYFYNKANGLDTLPHVITFPRLRHFYCLPSHFLPVCSRAQQVIGFTLRIEPYVDMRRLKELVFIEIDRTAAEENQQQWL